MSLTVQPRWETKCTDCGQLTVRWHPPADDEECERCAVLRTLGLILSPPPLLGLRVEVVTLSAGITDAQAVGCRVGVVLVRGIGPVHKPLAIPCTVADLGTWTPLSAFVGPDYLDQPRPPEEPA